MKSQDILLLLKLVSLHKQERATEAEVEGVSKAWPLDWQGWDDIGDWNSEDDQLLLPAEQYGVGEYVSSRYTARALEKQTGISKSQINLALNRCIDVGLAKMDHKSGLPRANSRALFDFIVHGLKYVFPVKPGAITRGIGTAFAAPVLKGKLMSAGEFVLVWPDAKGKTKGQAIEPLYKSVAYAVRRDPEMYALLALVDAIRVGQPREANLAANMLKLRMGA